MTREEIDKMFARDIELHGIAERETDATTEAIHRALREALCWGEAHAISYFRDSPGGTTELEGEYNLRFVAKAIRAALPDNKAEGLNEGPPSPKGEPKPSSP